MSKISSPDPATPGERTHYAIGALPKVDLHRHLEGSLRLDSLVEIASALDLDLPRSVGGLGPLVQMSGSEAKTAETFFAKFATIRHFFQNVEIIRRLVAEVIEDAALDQVRALELRFTPTALREHSNLSVSEIIQGVVDVAQESASRYDMGLSLIVSINRHEGIERAEEVIERVMNDNGEGIQGIDLAGAEDGFDLELFTPLLKRAKQAGQRLTIHAGEWGGPEAIAYAIETMQADRIGHGIHIMEDPAVVQLAKEYAIGFEISPTSNARTGAYPSHEPYPLSAMIDAGLRVAITTDDPSIFQTTLSQEHMLAVEAFGLSIETLKGLTLQALQLSFLEKNQQRKLEMEFMESFWGVRL